MARPSVESFVVRRISQGAPQPELRSWVKERGLSQAFVWEVERSSEFSIERKNLEMSFAEL